MEVKNFNCDLVFQNRFAGFGHLNRDVERFSSGFSQILWNLLERERGRLLGFAGSKTSFTEKRTWQSFLKINGQISREKCSTESEQIESQRRERETAYLSRLYLCHE